MEAKNINTRKLAVLCGIGGVIFGFLRGLLLPGGAPAIAQLIGEGITGFITGGIGGLLYNHTGLSSKLTLEFEGEEEDER